MIITRTPFRISLFGGSTDYKEYYSNWGSSLIGFSINKYTYLAGRFTPEILSYYSRFSYSKSEIINKDDFSSFEDYLSKIQHNGIRGVLSYLSCSKGLELSHFCDIPSQTGLGSSSTFVVGLLKLIHSLNDRYPSKKSLAKTAIKIERDILREAGGIQDQIWAAYGGFNSIEIKTDGNFFVKPLPVSEEFTTSFLDRSFLLYTGSQRDSFDLAKHPESSLQAKHKIAGLSSLAYEAFSNQDIDSIGVLLDESWDNKRKINNGISNPEIDKTYSFLKENGMIGGKLLGAGSSGFIFGILKKDTYLDSLPESIMNNLIDFNIDYEGSKIIYA